MQTNIKPTNHLHINQVIEKYNKEKLPYKKVHILIDLIEVIIKTHVAYIMGVYFSNDDISNELKSFIAYGLKKHL